MAVWRIRRLYGQPVLITAAAPALLAWRRVTSLKPRSRSTPGPRLSASVHRVARFAAMLGRALPGTRREHRPRTRCGRPPTRATGRRAEPPDTMHPMVTNQAIREITDRIVAEFRPRKIILFGSQARRASDAESDIDLLVILEFEGPAYRQAAKIRAALPSSVPIDVIARTPASVAARVGEADPVTHEALRTGVVVYSVAA